MIPRLIEEHAMITKLEKQVSLVKEMLEHVFIGKCISANFENGT